MQIVRYAAIEAAHDIPVLELLRYLGDEETVERTAYDVLPAGAEHPSSQHSIKCS
jgi:hypothetical protein